MMRFAHTDVEALREALDLTYRGYALYDQLIKDFGNVRPLEGIRDVDALHIAVLRSLWTRCDCPLPRNRWLGRSGSFRDLAHGCAAAIAAESARANAYRSLLETADSAEILAELRNLERASRDGHLPALRVLAVQLAHARPCFAGKRERAVGLRPG